MNSTQLKTVVLHRNEDLKIINFQQRAEEMIWGNN